MRYYPIYLNLTNRPAFVVGGGTIAEGKVLGLLEVDAQVTVIAPEPTPALRELARNGKIAWEQRAYQQGDLQGAAIAISATDERDVNKQVWDEAQERGILINVVDDPPYCDFIAPAIIRRGDITLAISTNGKMPALAAHLRRELEKSFGDEYLQLLEMTAPMREQLNAQHLDYSVRQQLWRKLFEETNIVDLLRQGETESARSVAKEILGL
jgi:precorrin-2 dehydrogenase / sirohydrochlorin ferrochelatase